jgi:hypothetical protein
VHHVYHVVEAATFVDSAPVTVQIRRPESNWELSARSTLTFPIADCIQHTAIPDGRYNTSIDRIRLRPIMTAGDTTGGQPYV